VISVTSSAIYIDDGTYTFEDVYQEVSDTRYYYKAKKIGEREYYFDFDFYIGKNSEGSLEDENVSVEVTSSYFQIYEGSSFRLGNKNNGKVINGCYFYAPELTLGYGFGCSDKDDIYTKSGNLFLYGSYIEAPCFWGFFNEPDKQIVEIEDCLIIGFGRISGNSSYVKNTTYLHADTNYGTVSVLGEVSSLENIKINNVDDDAYGLYFNPNISGDCVISNLEAHNYTNLIYCVSCDDPHTLTLINPIIEDLTAHFEDSNSTIVLKNRVSFRSSNDTDVVKIYYNDELVDTLVMSDRTYSDLTYITKTQNVENEFSDYKIVINDTIQFVITPSEPFTVDVDTYLSLASSATQQTVSSSTNIFLLPKKVVMLGDIYTFFIYTTSEPTVELRKSTNNKIADPYEVVKINDYLYRVSFLIGELAESSDTGEVWQDGAYIIYCAIESNYYWESIQVAREIETTTDGTTDVSTDTEYVTTSTSSGAQIYM